MALLETDPRKFEPIDLRVEPTGGVVATHARRVLHRRLADRGAGGRAHVDCRGGSGGDSAIDAPIASIRRGSLRPKPVTFDSNGKPVHAFYYAPKNPDYEAPPGERPPLLVLSHGGPTGATEDVLDEEVQFWTSRGFAVLDVNYGGSTGYGRDYRDRLNGQWGIVDVADCVNGAQVPGGARARPIRRA